MVLGHLLVRLSYGEVEFLFLFLPLYKCNIFQVILRGASLPNLTAFEYVGMRPYAVSFGDF